MKIIVDYLPKHPKECLFSKRSPEYGFYCSFDKKECRAGLCDFLTCLKIRFDEKEK